MRASPVRPDAKDAEGALSHTSENRVLIPGEIERNTWADDLANLDTSGFNPQRRHRPFEANMRNANMDFLAELLTKGRQLGLHDGKRARLPPPKPVSPAN